MRCQNCTEALPNDARFCPACGHPRHGQHALASNSFTSLQMPTTAQSPIGRVAPPSWNRADELQRAMATQRSFVTPAVITLVLYVILWLPGFIANIAYLFEIRNVQRVSGQEPEGKGCLVALFFVCGLVPGFLLFCVIFGGLTALF